jgi:hypothetical protein
MSIKQWYLRSTSPWAKLQESPKGQTPFLVKCKHISVFTLAFLKGSPLRFCGRSDLLDVDGEEGKGVAAKGERGDEGGSGEAGEEEEGATARGRLPGDGQ